MKEVQMPPNPAEVTTYSNLQWAKISHTLATPFDEANHDKKTKYAQLYQTFKKSLGISAD